MKVLDKSRILQQNKTARVLMEQEILMLCSNPFIVKLFYSFQTRDYLHFVIEVCIGGTLFRLVQGQPGSRIHEKFVRFYVAELLLALDHLHSMGYVHRDIKPENILISVNGHIKLADFDLSACINQQHQLPGVYHRPRLSSFVGTPDYLSPEVVAGKMQSYSLDFWSVGVLIFEMIFGGSPFAATPMRASGDTSAVFKYVIPSEPKISKHCRSLISQLLQLNDKRLGHRIGAREILQHPWFEDIDLANMEQMQPPFDPRIYLQSNTDTRYFNLRKTRKLSKKFYSSPLIVAPPPSDPFSSFMLLSSPILSDDIAADPAQAKALGATQMLDHSDHCGWLKKQGSFRKTWKLRWFVLNGSTLRYYRGPDAKWWVSQIDLAEAKGVIPADLGRFKMLLPSDTRTELVFHIQCSHNRFYHFICPDLPAKEAWITALTNTLARLSSNDTDKKEKKKE